MEKLSKYEGDDPNFHVVLFDNNFSYFIFTLLHDNKTWLGIYDGSDSVINVSEEPFEPFYE